MYGRVRVVLNRYDDDDPLILFVMQHLNYLWEMSVIYLRTLFSYMIEHSVIFVKLLSADFT